MFNYLTPNKKKKKLLTCILSKCDISKQVCSGSLKGLVQSPAQPKDNLLLSNQYKCAAEHLFHLERDILLKYFILVAEHKEFFTCFCRAVYMHKIANLHKQMCNLKSRCQRTTCKTKGLKN